MITVKELVENIRVEAQFGNAAAYVETLIEESKNTAALYFVLQEAINQLRKDGTLKESIYRSGMGLNEKLVVKGKGKGKNAASNSREAFEEDDDFYAEDDPEHGPSVFGNKSGFSYASPGSMDRAKEIADEKRAAKKRKSTPRRRSAGDDYYSHGGMPLGESLTDDSWKKRVKKHDAVMALTQYTHWLSENGHLDDAVPDIDDLVGMFFDSYGRGPMVGNAMRSKSRRARNRFPH